MAFLQMVNGKCRTLPNDKATQLWLYMHGEAAGTDELIKFAAQVKHIWLNSNDAPPSYIELVRRRRGIDKQARLPV